MRRSWMMLLLAVLCMPAAAQAWWNKDWRFRTRVDLDPAAAAAQVVPVRLHAGNFAFADAKPDGSDLRFVAGDDKTPLNFHFETYSGTDQIAIAWVQVPAGGQPGLWIYHGNPDAAAAANARSSYDPAYSAVLHFGEKDGAVHDATSFNTAVGSFTGHLGAAGIAASGAHFAPTESLVLADGPQLQPRPGGGLTFSAWIKLGDPTTPALILSRGNNQSAIELGVANGKLYVQVTDGKERLRADAAEAFGAGVWRHLVLAWSDRLVAFVDRKQALSMALAARPIVGDLVVGANPALGAGFGGDLDELQLATIAWPAGTVAATFVAQDPVVEAAPLTGEETRSGSSFDLTVFKTLANAVTVDGWAVVVIIALLGFVSGEVMLSKLLLLRRIQSANDKFLAGFRSLGADPTTLTLPAAGKRPPLGLLALYKGGVEEFRRQREAASAAGARALAPGNLEVIKANVETAIVNESFRMNRSLVLLTLAVSAAPFLGLLGTVVGIMVTFGSIATVGDVNVSTIAPGIAAALVCTVAGLAVAIPVMFGYNFLATRVRELTMAMEVFANELVGRLAVAPVAA